MPTKICTQEKDAQNSDTNKNGKGQENWCPSIPLSTARNQPQSLCRIAQNPRIHPQRWRQRRERIEPPDRPVEQVRQIVSGDHDSERRRLVCCLQHQQVSKLPNLFRQRGGRWRGGTGGREGGSTHERSQRCWLRSAACHPDRKRGRRWCSAGQSRCISCNSARALIVRCLPSPPHPP